MWTTKFKWFYGLTIFIGVILILTGLLLFIPRVTRSDTPDIYYYNIYSLRYLLPTAGILLVVIGTSVNALFNSLKEEIMRLQESCRSLEKRMGMDE